MHLPALLLAVLLLAGCSESTQVAANAVDNAADVAVEAAAAVEDKADEAATVTAEVATPVVLAVREVIEQVTPSVEAPQVPTDRNIAADLIIRWEIGSKARYTKLYQGVICPGGASGPTIGIGYDLGTQTSATIRKDWSWHPSVDALATASGQVGPAACKVWQQSHRGIRVTYAEAERVFITDTLPSYTRMAERALRKGWSDLSPGYMAGMASLGYNRGWSMVGSRNTEKREIRDTCVPAADKACGAGQVISMCRLWAGTTVAKGLCDRRKDEARVIRS